MPAPIRTGTSGWNFRWWNDTTLYKDKDSGKKIGPAKQLDRYSSLLSCVELNASFYRVPKEQTWKNWKTKMEDYPDHFQFAVKMHKYGTHMKLLKDPETWFPVFWDRVQLLGERLGPILIQLPPRFGYSEDNYTRLEALGDILPDHPFVFEFRNQTWTREHLYDLFTRKKWSVVVTHINNTPARWNRRNKGKPWTQLDTGWSNMGLNGHVYYIRLHGTTGQYTGLYDGTEDGRVLLTQIREGIESGLPVWVIHNNTDSTHNDVVSGTSFPCATRDAMLYLQYALQMIPKEKAWSHYQKMCEVETPGLRVEKRVVKYLSWREDIEALGRAFDGELISPIDQVLNKKAPT